MCTEKLGTAMDCEAEESKAVGMIRSWTVGHLHQTLSAV